MEPASQMTLAKVILVKVGERVKKTTTVLVVRVRRDLKEACARSAQRVTVLKTALLMPCGFLLFYKSATHFYF